MKKEKIKKNPFVFGKVVTDEDFINRKEERQIITREIESSTNIILYAPRRYGKTSLIMQVFNDLEKKHKNFCGLVVDFYNVNTKEKFLSLLINEYTKKSGLSFDKVLKMLKNILSGLSTSITFDEFGNPKAEIKLKPSENLLKAEEILQLPKRLADLGRLVCVFFDEFQEIKNLNGIEFQKELRAAIQYHNNVSYIFSGSKFHMFNDIFTQQDSPLYNIGKTIKLDKIKEISYRRIILNRLKKVHHNVRTEHAIQIYNRVDGIPYYVQMLSHEIYNLAILNPDTEMQTLIDQASENIIASKNDEFLIIYENLSLAAKRILDVLIKENSQKIFSKETLSLHQLPIATVQRALRTLIEKGVIGKEKNRYYVQDVFLKQWLKMKL